MGEIARRAEPADDAAARKEARALLGLLGAGGWLKPIFDLDLRGCCLMREALGEASPLADAVFALQGLGNDADPVGRIRGAEGPLARADRRGEGDDRIRHDRAAGGIGRRPRIATTARRDGSGWVLDGCEALDLERRHRRSLCRFRLDRPSQGLEGDQLLPRAGRCARAPVRRPSGHERAASAGRDRFRGLSPPGGRAARQRKAAGTGSASRRSTGCGPRSPRRRAGWRRVR